MSDGPGTSEMRARLSAIENVRVDAASRIGAPAAREIALMQLRLLLLDMQQALGVKPDDRDRRENAWAVAVEIERVRRSKASRRHLGR